MPEEQQRRVRSRAPGEPRRVAYLYLLPAFAFYLLFAFGPLVYTTWLSFFDWDGLTVGKWIGLDNYDEVLSDPDIRASFVHSFELILFYAVLPRVSPTKLEAATISAAGSSSAAGSLVGGAGDAPADRRRHRAR